MKDFFGFGTEPYPYGKPAEGFLSWQHIVFVSVFVVVGVFLAVFLGLRNKNKDENTKNKVLIYLTLLIIITSYSSLIVPCFAAKNQFDKVTSFWYIIRYERFKDY